MTTLIQPPAVEEQEAQDTEQSRTPGWVERIRDLRGRRPVTAVLVALLAAAFLYGGTSVNSARPGGSAVADASNCVYHGGRWHLVTSGAISGRYGEAHFGATVCMDNSANVTGVIPNLGGDIEGIGTTFGFSWTAVSTTVDYKGHYAHVHGVAKAKMCLPLRGSPICSMTDTQDFDLVVITVYGPYAPGTGPHLTVHSQTRDMMGGTAPATRFVAF